MIRKHSTAGVEEAHARARCPRAASPARRRARPRSPASSASRPPGRAAPASWPRSVIGLIAQRPTGHGSTAIAARAAVDAGRRPYPRPSGVAGGDHDSRRTRSGVSRFSTGRLWARPRSRQVRHAPGRAGLRRPGRGRPSGSVAVGRRRRCRPRQRCVRQVEGGADLREQPRARAGGSTGRPSRGADRAARWSSGEATAAAMIAASGSTRPGALSRCRARPSRASQSARTTASCRRVRTRCSPAGAPPRILPRRRWRSVQDAPRTLRAPSSSLPCRVSSSSSASRRSIEDLDVERGVAQPRLGQRPAATSRRPSAPWRGRRPSRTSTIVASPTRS